MISKIKGIVDDIENNSFTVMTSGGVGYHVYSTVNIISSLKLGEQVNIFIETQVREDSIRLFGFNTIVEKMCFNLLCTVQGVGAKVALSILSSLTVNQLYGAISLDDKDLISTANGVGPKMAGRIVSELKSKINNLQKFISLKTNGLDSTGNVGDSESFNPEQSEQLLLTKMNAVTALVNLGYKKLDAMNAISFVISERIKNNQNMCINLSELIRSALKTFELK